jgi:hypothetical protein
VFYSCEGRGVQSTEDLANPKRDWTVPWHARDTIHRDPILFDSSTCAVAQDARHGLTPSWLNPTRMQRRRILFFN